MYRNLRLKISEGELARLHQTTNAINGVQLPKKDRQGYRMQDIGIRKKNRKTGGLSTLSPEKAPIYRCREAACKAPAVVAYIYDGRWRRSPAKPATILSDPPTPLLPARQYGLKATQKPIAQSEWSRQGAAAVGAYLRVSGPLGPLTCAYLQSPIFLSYSHALSSYNIHH